MILVDDFSDLSQNQKSELVEIFGMTLLNFQKNSKLVGIRSILAIKKQFLIESLNIIFDLLNN